MQRPAGTPRRHQVHRQEGAEGQGGIARERDQGPSQVSWIFLSCFMLVSF